MKLLYIKMTAFLLTFKSFTRKPNSFSNYFSLRDWNEDFNFKVVAIGYVISVRRHIIQIKMF